MQCGSNSVLQLLKYFQIIKSMKVTSFKIWPPGGFRKILVTIFFAWFVYLLSTSIAELLDPPQGISLSTKKGAKFPSITICPTEYLNGEKREDFGQLPSLLDFLRVMASVKINSTDW